MIRTATPPHIVFTVLWLQRWESLRLNGGRCRLRRWTQRRSLRTHPSDPHRFNVGYDHADAAYAHRRNSRSLAKKKRLNMMNGLGGIRPGRGVEFGSYSWLAGGCSPSEVSSLYVSLPFELVGNVSRLEPIRNPVQIFTTVCQNSAVRLPRNIFEYVENLPFARCTYLFARSYDQQSTEHVLSLPLRLPRILRP